jgi:hypothetical protein
MENLLTLALSSEEGSDATGAVRQPTVLAPPQHGEHGSNRCLQLLLYRVLCIVRQSDTSGDRGFSLGP